MRSKAVLVSLGLTAVLHSVSAASAAQATSATHAAPKTGTVDITLVKASDESAVIREPDGTLSTIKVGDSVGTLKAVVKEISTRRLVLDETFTDKDGAPNRATIIFDEGQRGGTRYFQRPGSPKVIGTKAPTVTPLPAGSESTKPAPKKPPQM